MSVDGYVLTFQVILFVSNLVVLLWPRSPLPRLLATLAWSSLVSELVFLGMYQHAREDSWLAYWGGNAPLVALVAGVAVGGVLWKYLSFFFMCRCGGENEGEEDPQWIWLVIDYLLYSLVGAFTLTLCSFWFTGSEQSWDLLSDAQFWLVWMSTVLVRCAVCLLFLAYYSATQ